MKHLLTLSFFLLSCSLAPAMELASAFKQLTQSVTQLATKVAGPKALTTTIDPEKLTATIQTIYDNTITAINQQFPNFLMKKWQQWQLLNDTRGIETASGTREFILQTVKDLVAQHEQDPQLTPLLTRMISTGFLEEFATAKKTVVIKGKRERVPNRLEYCNCIPFAKRVAFSITLLYDIFKQFPDKDQELVYTSFGAGGLWQDYLTLQGLLWAGYTNVHLNLIDISYPDIWQMAFERLEQEAKEKAKVASQKVHERFIEWSKLEFKEQINLFKEKLLSDVSLVYDQTGRTIALTTHIFNNAYEYIERTQQNPRERSNVLVMVDVDIRYPMAMGRFPSLANTLRFFVKGGPSTNEPHFYAFIPRHGPVQLYRLKVESPAVQQAETQLIQLAQQTGAVQKFTPTFYNELLKPVTQFDIPEGKFSIREMRFASDPFIAFYDMLFEVLTDNAIVFTLYRTEYPSITDTSKITKVDVAAYKQQNPIEILEPLLKRSYEKVAL